jgi:uncharacterized membrane protein YbhN (UPF0104 family)
VFGATESHLLIGISLFAAGWIAGFLTPGAPAGLGVRDAILLAGLTPLYGGREAVGITLVLRLVTTVGDGIGFLLATLARGQVSPGVTQPK